MKTYKKENGNLIITIPLKKRRYNPYKEMAGNSGDVGEMDNLIGVIDKKDDWEIGFAYRIDRSYKGKDDDISSIFLHYLEGEEEFKKLCKEIGIDFVMLSEI